MLIKILPFLIFFLAIFGFNYKQKRDRIKEKKQVIEYIRELNNTTLNGNDKIIIRQIKDYKKGVDLKDLKGKSLKEKQEEYREKSFNNLKSVFD